MKEYIIALQGNSDSSKQVFYVLCASISEAIELTKSAKGALSDPKVVIAGVVEGPTGLNLEPKQPKQWI